MGVKRLDELARERTERAIRVIEDIMEDPFAEYADRMRAAKEMLDRGHGKPVQAVIAVPATQRQRAVIARMTDHELIEIIQETRLPRLVDVRPEPAPIDAQFEEFGAIPLDTIIRRAEQEVTPASPDDFEDDLLS